MEALPIQVGKPIRPETHANNCLDKKSGPWSVAVRAYNFQGWAHQHATIQLVYNKDLKSYDIHHNGKNVAESNPELRVQPAGLRQISWALDGTKIRFRSSRWMSASDGILDITLYQEDDLKELVAVFQASSHTFSIDGVPSNEMDRMFDFRLEAQRRKIDSPTPASSKSIPSTGLLAGAVDVSGNCIDSSLPVALGGDTSHGEESSLFVEEVSTRATINILRRDIARYTKEIETADARLRATQLKEQRAKAALDQHRAELNKMKSASGESNLSHSETKGATLVKLLERQHTGERTAQNKNSPTSVPKARVPETKAATAGMIAPNALDASLKQARTQIQAQATELQQLRSDNAQLRARIRQMEQRPGRLPNGGSSPPRRKRPLDEDSPAPPRSAPSQQVPRYSHPPVKEVDKEFICPLKKQDGSTCGKRTTGVSSLSLNDFLALKAMCSHLPD
ncbi:MAG: hypothetical protein Q9207_007805 [Kuettlingeria erythrocarpa]